MPKLYDKEDLAKLKDSKPVPIIAHSHEVIVPVVYAGMVNRFLEKKGVHLPLTHHELADMKREADCPGYATGTKDLKKKKKRRVKTKAKPKVNVIQPRAVGLVPQPPPLTRAQILYSQLRPDNYSSIRPLIQPGYTQPSVIPDYRREEEQKRKLEEEAVRRYKEETEHRIDQLKRLEQIEKNLAEQREPLRKDPQQKPLSYWSEDSWAPSDYRYETEDEERQAVWAGLVHERLEARHERRKKKEKAEVQAETASEIMRAAKAEIAQRQAAESSSASASGVKTPDILEPVKRGRGRPKKSEK